MDRYAAAYAQTRNTLFLALHYGDACCQQVARPRVADWLDWRGVESPGDVWRVSAHGNLVRVLWIGVLRAFTAYAGYRPFPGAFGVLRMLGVSSARRAETPLMIRAVGRRRLRRSLTVHS